jgi:glutamine kinase
LVKKSKIPGLVYFTAGEWYKNPVFCIQKIRKHIVDPLVAVRSSSLTEDCWNSSNAGAFTSLLNIDSSNNNLLINAIDRVIASYGSDSESNQVLVQEMVNHVSLSGVLFTRSIDLDAPYFVVNYDDITGKTDTVTSGLGKTLRTVFLYKGHPEFISKVDENLKPVTMPMSKLRSCRSVSLIYLEKKQYCVSCQMLIRQN